MSLRAFAPFLGLEKFLGELSFQDEIGFLKNSFYELPQREENFEIESLINDLSLSGGKRLRPLLGVAVGECFSVSQEKLSPFLRIAEMTHAATLIHDDVIDLAEERRGRPTLNLVKSNAEAVLAGDYLIAQIIEEMAATGRLDLLSSLAQVVKKMVKGEWLQKEARFQAFVSESHLLSVAAAKTASLIEWVMVLGPELAKAPLSTKEAFSQMAIDVGVAFQMADDVLDFEEATGKEPFQDLREGLVNFVSWDLLSSRPSYKESLCELFKTQSFEVFWSAEDISESQNRIRLKAQARVERAKSCLLEQRKVFSLSEPQEKAFQLLEHLFDRVVVRKI